MYITEQNPTVKEIMKILHRYYIWQNEAEPPVRKAVRMYLFFFYCILFQIFNDVSAYLSDDMNETIFSTEIGMFYVVINLKQFYLLWKKDEIKSFLNDPITSHSTQYREAFEYVNNKLNKFMGFIHVYLWMLGVTSTFIVMCCFPIFTTKKMLPFFISYSFEWTQSEIIYWITFGFVTLAVFYGFLFNLVTVFVWYLMFHYSLAYEVLGYKIRKMGTNQHTEHTTESNLYGTQLIDSIESHRNILG